MTKLTMFITNEHHFLFFIDPKKLSRMDLNLWLIVFCELTSKVRIRVVCPLRTYPVALSVMRGGQLYIPENNNNGHRKGSKPRKKSLVEGRVVLLVISAN